jgi:hypothetical protein
MKTTLHGKLPLTIYPPLGARVTEGGRVELCCVRGDALGRHINIQVTLDLNTGEVLLFSPDGFVGTWRMGDLVAAHIAGQMAREPLLRAHLDMVEDDDVAQAH